MSQAILTPTAGRVLKRSLFWVGVVAFLVVLILIVLGTAGSQAGGTRLDIENPAPPGTRAVAEVLRQQGVTVTGTSSLADTRRAITDPDRTTLLIYDPGLYLSDDQLREALSLAETVIIADASFDEVSTVAPELALAGYAGGTLRADCDLPAARKAGTITSDGVGYRLVDGSAATLCFGSEDDAYSLVQLDRSGGSVVVLGATSALTNEHIVEEGNAALALNLLGEHPDLVWYLPSADDLPLAEPQDLGSLSPPWLTPALTLLVLTFVAGAVWRGRRLGPLVVENLPVTVRASETMLGRARLYQKSAARLRALDALRIGSVQRLASLCGLPRTATVDDVVAAVASATGEQVAGIRRLLVDAVPAGDAELVVLSDELLELERDVAAAVRP
ncbi:DUF4350 domain-containing protein [soil metagenome]